MSPAVLAAWVLQAALGYLAVTLNYRGVWDTGGHI